MHLQHTSIEFLNDAIIVDCKSITVEKFYRKKKNVLNETYINVYKTENEWNVYEIWVDIKSTKNIESEKYRNIFDFFLIKRLTENFHCNIKIYKQTYLIHSN